jgi:nicotinamide-nucleotide amidase
MLSATDLELTHLAGRLADRLRAARARLVTAESCTGGWVAKVCTDLPGSSAWFDCGFVTYGNDAKQRDLEVSAETLRAHGAVSEATVREMAAGALRRARAQLAISISGIAGPDGGTADKPVGTVWFAVAGAFGGVKREAVARVEHFIGDRDDVRRGATARALQLGIDFIQ